MSFLKAQIPFSSARQAILYISCLILSLMINLPVQAQSQSELIKKLDFSQPVEIFAINKDGDFILKSGQTLRSAELNLPSTQDCDRLAQVCSITKKIRDYYTQNLVGRTVMIDQSTIFSDRYNRLHAHIQISGENWLQYTLLSLGLARVETLHPSPLTTPFLLAAEATAREQKVGIWSLKAFEPLSVDIPKSKMDRFQIIEGTIQETADVKGVIYLNFGDNWREDFTIKLPADIRRKFVDKGQSLLGLKDHRIRIRGWLFWENGPMISLYHPEQLEILTPQ
ncbi:thermonuclease family protein [Kiloniella antarctica]|uniref:Thermonuclease family protein n=1 Tax=Kiloniella antarctica TaxID=1550907 RepID=A0ABW5BI85_9PROT